MESLESLEFLGTYTLRQSDACFKLGRDSVLLGGFATVRPGWRVCDLGCGIGSLLLLLSQRQERLTRFGVELDPRAAELARENLAHNGLSGSVLTGDLRDKSLLPADSMDLVLANPPYFKAGSGKSGGRARMDETCSPEELCAAAGRLLRSGGYCSLVYRPERLPDLFAALRAARIEPKRMQLLYYDRRKPPFAVLTEGVKDASPSLAVLPAYYQEA